jgi:hypothetical protein
MSATEDCYCGGTGYDGICSPADLEPVSAGGGIVATLVGIVVSCVLIAVSATVIVGEASKTMSWFDMVTVAVVGVAFMFALFGCVISWGKLRERQAEQLPPDSTDVEVRRRALSILIATVSVRGLRAGTSELAALVAGAAIPAGGSIEEQARRLVVLALNAEADRVGLRARCVLADLVVA